MVCAIPCQFFAALSKAAEPSSKCSSNRVTSERDFMQKSATTSYYCTYTNAAVELVAKTIFVKYSELQCLFWGIITVADWTMFRHHFKYMDLPTIRETSWISATVTLPTHFVLFHNHRSNLSPPFLKIIKTVIFKQDRKPHKPQSYSTPEWLKEGITQLQCSLACLHFILIM